jgi:carboxymethylenebutenolidase
MLYLSRLTDTSECRSLEALVHRDTRMCNGSEARPPLPPIAGGSDVIRERGFVLTAEDGNLLGAHHALASHEGGPGIVVLPDVRGLHLFYRELALRFAQAGVHACAIDYFGRTAGVGSRAPDFDHGPHVDQTTDDTVAMDAAAAIAHLRSPAGGGATVVFSVGFCFGGRNSFNLAARGYGLAGVIGFYGRVVRHPGDEEDTPLELAERYGCPVLGLFGGADHSIHPDDIESFRTELNRAGVANELIVYEGAPHSFFDRSQEQFLDACDDAWRRILSFIRRTA